MKWTKKSLYSKWYLAGPAIGLVLSLVALRSFLFSPGLVHWGDLRWSFKSEMHMGWYTWDKYSQSPVLVNYILAWWWIPLISPEISERLYFVMIFMLMSTTIFYVTFKITEMHEKDPLIAFLAAFVSTTFFTLNPIVPMRLQHVPLLWFYAFLPLLFLLSYQAFHQINELSRSSLLKKSIIIAFVLFLSSVSIRIPFYLPVFFFCIFVNISRPLGLYLKRAFMLTTMTIALFAAYSAIWLLPLIFGFSSSYLKYIMTSEVVEMLSTNSEILHVIGLHSNWSSIWFEQVFTLSGGLQYIWYGASIILPLLAFSSLLFRPRSKFLIAMTSFSLVVVFLAKGTNSPMNQFYTWLVFESPFLASFGFGWQFRAPNKWNLMLAFSYSILISITISRILHRIRTRCRSQKLGNTLTAGIVLLVISFLSLLAYPMLTGDVSGNMKPKEIPPDYIQLNQWLEIQGSNFKVLVYPTPPPWGVPVPTPSSDYNQYWNYVESVLLNNKIHHLGSYLRFWNIRYFIVREEVLSNEENGILSILQEQEDLKLVRRFNHLWIFENEEYLPQIFVGKQRGLLAGGLDTFSSVNFLSRTLGFDFPAVVVQEQSLWQRRELLDHLSESDFLINSGTIENALILGGGEFIFPFDHTIHHKPQTVWSRAGTNDPIHGEWHMYLDKWMLENWDFDHGKGIVFTWAPFSIDEPSSVKPSNLIAKYDFEHRSFNRNILNNWSISEKNNQTLLFSHEAYEGQYSIQVELLNSTSGWATINSPLIPAEYSNSYKWEFYVKGENADRVHAKIFEYDESRTHVTNQQVATIDSGYFNWTKISFNCFPTSVETRYIQLQIWHGGETTSILPHKIWLDNVRVYNLTDYLKPNMIEMPFRLDTTRSYDLYIRYFQNKDGGKIALTLDSNPIEIIDTTDQLSNFVWKKVSSYNISRGQHTLTLENQEGFNAVNLFALIPRDELIELKETVEALLQDKRMIYILEAESDMYNQNTKKSNKYGGAASNGEILEFMPLSKVWKEVEILNPGKYTIVTRGNGTLNVKIDEIEYTANSTQLDWTYIGPVDLEKGKHRIEVTTPSTSFQWDFENYTQDWTANKPDTQTLSLDTNSFEGPSGLKVELLNSTWGWKTINSPLISIEYGKYYKWEFDVKGENASEVHAKIIEYDENNTQLSATRLGRLAYNGNFTWRYINFEYTPTAQNASYVRLQIWHGHNTTQPLPNKIWIDNVRVTPSDTPIQWAFENDTQGWTVNMPEPDIQILNLDQNSFGGNYSLKAELLNSTMGWKTISSPLTPAEFDKIYKWEFDVKGENASEVHAKIVEYDENNTQLSETRYPRFTETGNFTWRHINFEYTPTAQNASYVRLQIWHGHNTTQPLPNRIWIDNVRVTPSDISDTPFKWDFKNYTQSWTVNIPEPNIQILSLDQNSFEGNYSLKNELLNSTWHWKTINSPFIPAEFGKIYKWEFYVKGENAHEVHAQLVEYDDNNTQISTTRYPYFTETGNFTWRNINFEYTPTAQNASYMQLQIWHGQNTTQPLPNKIWIDNASVYSIHPADLDVIWIYSTQKEKETLVDVFTPKENPAEIITCQIINPTKYVVKVKATEPFMLSFAESYDPLWNAYVNGEEVETIPLYTVINGFWINQIGELIITIEFEPQRWFYYGSVVSITSLIGSLTYTLWDRKRKLLWS